MSGLGLSVEATVALTTLLAYLIGSFPTAYVLVKARTGTDIRTLGSGNVGATNAGRILGRKYFWYVFLVDLLKGFLPTYFLPQWVEFESQQAGAIAEVLCAVAVILGHNFPVFLGFRGGKGVATSLGAVLAVDPRAAGLAALAFVVSVFATRYISASSLLAATVFAFAHYLLTPEPWSAAHAPLSVAIVALWILMVYRHRTNLVRLARGTEPKVSLSRGKKNG